MSTERAELRVLHLQHYVYPYRIPLFEELGLKVHLDVFFCRKKRRIRRWDTVLPLRRSYGARVLRAVSVGPLTFNPGLLWALRKRYDVYTVAGLDAITLLQFLQIYFVARLRRVPFILVDEFIDTEYYRSKKKLLYWINKVIRKLVYSRIDAFVIWNKAGLEWAKRLGARHDRLFFGPQVLSPGIHRFSPAEPEQVQMLAAPQHATRTVLFVGHLIERKGVHVLIQAFRELEEQDLRLVIVGNGPYERVLRQIAGADRRIIFRGYLEGVQKQEEFKQADVFVLPSLHEPWGFVVNEAITWGLPVIVTEVAGSADYLVSGNGYVVPPGDCQALQRAIRHLITDRDFNQRCRQESIRLSKEFGISDMAAPFLDAINCVTGAD